jgi:uncharacterized RDD family membrane protein YckC
MSSDQPPPGGPGGPEDPFSKPHQGGSPYDEPYGDSLPPRYGGSPYPSEPGVPDPLHGMPPLANRGRRLLARIIDAFIIGVPVYVVTGAIWNNWDYHNTVASWFQSAIYAVLYIVYQVVLLTRSGQSLGKKVMKIRVGMLADGSNPTTEAALKREVTYALVPVIPCCGSVFWLVNVLWCLWDKPYRQCLHDKVGKTVVVAAT